MSSKIQITNSDKNLNFMLILSVNHMVRLKRNGDELYYIFRPEHFK
jgi:hypothetical protein